jgi:hypothetical protein
MILRRWSDELPHDLEHFGFALHHEQGKHIGVLYHLDNGVPRFCHLGWNWSLRIDKPTQSYFWGKSGLDRYTKRFLAAQFDLIGRANPDTIPYGIDAYGKCFDSDGNYIPLPVGKGMTCASFIVSVFRSLGIPLIDETTWPKGRESDKEWGHWVLQMLRRDPAVPITHIDALKSDIDEASRFRPCEIAAALLSEDPPVPFEDAERLANEILAEMA